MFRRAIVATALVTLLSGCGLFGGDDSEDAKAEPSATIDPDRTSPDDLPEVPQIEDFEGAISDVEVGDCSTDEGKNKVTGTVENSTDDTQDYVITISWITARSDVVARGVATVEDVPAGDSRDWSATGTLKQSGEYTCTTQVQRGEL